MQCKYGRIGCNLEMKRKDMREHEEKTKVHFGMALNKIFRLEDKITILGGDLRAATERVTALERMPKMDDGTTMKFVFTQYHKRKERRESVDSSAAYIMPKGYRMAVRVFANGTRDGTGESKI